MKDSVSDSMKTILSICFTNLKSDSRVERQVRFLSERYHVVAAALGDPGVPGVQFIAGASMHRTLPRKLIFFTRLFMRRYERYYWNLEQVRHFASRLAAVSADVVLANDIDTLPLALKLAQQRGVPVIFDAHEYFPRQFQDQLVYRIFFQRYTMYLCDTYIPQVSAMITTNPSYAERYQHAYGIRSVIINNASDYVEQEPLLRPADDTHIRMIYHGVANPSRRIEDMIALMRYLDGRFTLDLVLVPGHRCEGYIRKLESMAQRDRRIRILPPLPMNELISFSHSYDIGIFLVPPTSFSYTYIMPNKLFQYIQSRLMVAIGPSPEMARIVRASGCGLVSDGFSPRSLAACLNSLDRTTINSYKQRSHQMARVLSSEPNRVVLHNLVARVLNHQEQCRAV